MKWTHWSFLAIAMAVLVGCGEAEGIARHDVTGTVNFEGKPVTEGTITFLDPKTSHAASAELSETGNYLVQVPDGTYKVTVTPPLEEAKTANPNISTGETMKQVANIPKKYHREMTTDLEAVVSSGAVEHNFELKP